MGVAGGSILKQLRMLGIYRGAAARVHTDLTLTGLETCRIAEKQTGISKDGGENIWSCPQVVSSYLGPRQFLYDTCAISEDRRISKILTLCNRSIWWTNLNVSGVIAFEGNFQWMRYKQYAVYFKKNVVGFATRCGWVAVVVCHLEILIGQALELVVL